MRHFRLTKSSLCILLTLAVNARSQQLGVYLGWVGTYPGNRLQEGARLAKQSGFQTIRVPLVASFETDFAMGRCATENRRLRLWPHSRPTQRCWEILRSERSF